MGKINSVYSFFMLHKSYLDQKKSVAVALVDKKDYNKIMLLLGKFSNLLFA